MELWRCSGGDCSTKIHLFCWNTDSKPLHLMQAAQLWAIKSDYPLNTSDGCVFAVMWFIIIKYYIANHHRRQQPHCREDLWLIPNDATEAQRMSKHCFTIKIVNLLDIRSPLYIINLLTLLPLLNQCQGNHLQSELRIQKRIIESKFIKSQFHQLYYILTVLLNQHS